MVATRAPERPPFAPADLAARLLSPWTYPKCRQRTSPPTSELGHPTSAVAALVSPTEKGSSPTGDTPDANH